MNPPKPTALRQIEGDMGKRGLPRREPKPDVLLPRDAVRLCPKQLQGEERRWWRYYFRKLCGPRVITDLDLSVVAMLSKDMADMLKHEETMRKTGPLYAHKIRRKIGKDKKGEPIFEDSVYPMVMPLWYVVNTLRDRIFKYLCQLGMTPSARARVSTIGPSAADAIEDALA